MSKRGVGGTTKKVVCDATFPIPIIMMGIYVFSPTMGENWIRNFIPKEYWKNYVGTGIKL